jgi:hypothetical protein
MERMRVGEDSYSGGGHGHEPDQVGSKSGVPGVDGPAADSRGKDQEAGGNASQHDGKGNPGGGVNLSDLPNGLSNLIITRTINARPAMPRASMAAARGPNSRR